MAKKLGKREKDKVCTKIDNYQLGDLIGKGGFGSVFKALNVLSGEVVAIKQVQADDLSKEHIDSYESEVNLLKMLEHRNIVKYIGCVKTSNHLNIIIEFVENGSLLTMLKKYGKMQESLVRVYMTQVLEGLAYLHEQGVIHRDIKGANILATKDGSVKLADFGVAAQTTGIQKESDVVGTPYWMAPEIIELSGAQTSSDIWSVGCTCIELLTGQPPYFELAPMTALFRIVSEDHPPIPEGISSALRDFLLQCFQKDPNLRVGAHKLLRHRWIRQLKKEAEKNKPKVEKPVVAPPPEPKLTLATPMKKYVEEEEEDWDADFESPVPTKTNSHTESTAGSLDGGMKKLNLTGSNMRLGENGPAPTVRDGKDIKRPLLIHPDDLSLYPHALMQDRHLAQYREGEDEDWDDLGVDAFDDEEDVQASNLNKPLVLHVPSQNEVETPAGLDELSDGEDIFDDLFEDEDEEMLLERDKQAQLQSEVNELLKVLRPDQNDGARIVAACERLIPIFKDHPELAQQLISQHAIMPITEILDSSLHADNNNSQVVRAVMQLINQIGENNLEIKEHVCLLGGIPIIMRFALRKFTRSIRFQAAYFAVQMCCSSHLTLQMFIACRGLSLLTDFLNVDFKSNRDVVHMTIDGIWAIFELKSMTSKNDFCRMLSKCGLLLHLGELLDFLVKTPDDDVNARYYTEKVVAMLLFFSRADSVVKKGFCRSSVLSTIFSVLPILQLREPKQAAQLLKALQHVASDPISHDFLERSGTISELLGVLERNEKQHPTHRSNEVVNHTLQTLFSLCRLNSTRLEWAAQEGAVPRLKAIVEQNSPLKEFALPLLCEMAHGTAATLNQLWNCSGVHFFLTVMENDNWLANAFDSLVSWLSNDRKRIEQMLLLKAGEPGCALDRLVQSFVRAERTCFEVYLQSFINLVSCSRRIAAKLIKTSLLSEVVKMLSHPNPTVRVSLLKLLKLLYANTKNKSTFKQPHIIDVVKDVRDADNNPVMATRLASEIYEELIR
eukprot:GCRY01001087.1.p1 GENE.GCRY01001087.1~~GCRY01001087.1.p1  ORF type:complete len:1008 (-),score=316.96 GCRY01001087.1:454-3477(-)